MRDASESESEFECCWNPTISGKSAIRRIDILIYVEFGLTVLCIKLSAPSTICCAEVHKNAMHVQRTNTEEIPKSNNLTHTRLTALFPGLPR